MAPRTPRRSAGRWPRPPPWPPAREPASRSSCRSSPFSGHTRGGAGNVDHAARNGFSFVFGAPITGELRERCDALWAESGRDPQRFDPHVTEAKTGSSQYVCIADTDEDAQRIGAPPA